VPDVTGGSIDGFGSQERTDDPGEEERRCERNLLRVPAHDDVDERGERGSGEYPDGDWSGLT